MRRTWVGLVVVVLLGVWAGPAGAKPSRSCAQALAKADRIVELFAEYVVADIDSVGNDDASLHAQGAKLGLSAKELTVADEYKAAARKCRAGK